jgi:hypothetical protein
VFAPAQSERIEAAFFSKISFAKNFSGTLRRSLENNDAGVSGTRRGDCFLERRAREKFSAENYFGDGKDFGNERFLKKLSR